MHKVSRYLLMLSLGLASLSCSSRKNKQVTIEKYEGPLIEVKDMELSYWSGEGKLTAILTAQEEEDFENGDRAFPKGIYVEYHNEKEIVVSTLKGNKAFYTKTDDLWKVTGDVVVRNDETDDQLNTEELFWDVDDKRIFSEKYVEIQTGNEVVYGDGLEAEQDFSSYKILKPKGIITLDDKEAVENEDQQDSDETEKDTNNEEKGTE